LQEELRDWLLSPAAGLTAACSGKAQLSIRSSISRSEATLFFCDIGDEDHLASLCVKQFKETSSKEILALYTRGIAFQPRLAECGVAVPTFVACNPALTALVMTIANGDCLQEQIIKSFFQGASSAAFCERAAMELGHRQRTLSRTSIPQELPMPSPCNNEEYVQRLLDEISHPYVASCLTTAAGTPLRMIDSLPAEFLQRHEIALLHGDFQAKNALVTARGNVTLIDLEFGRGHPLFDVAQFLTQLIRLSRRWNFSRATRLLRRYGNALLDGYFDEDNRHLRADLPFFMMWATTFSLMSDAHYPAPLRWYIKRHLQLSPLAAEWRLYG
jgi:tRNA A-37 threonylcarbamoyl transferase component Bud32